MKAFMRVWLSISLIAIGLGIGLLVIAAATGTRWEDRATFSMNESYKGIDSLDLDIGYGNVKILEGNEFSIAADNLPEDEFDSYVTDGTWYIKESGSKHFEIFDIDLPENVMLWWGDHFTPDITITIPKGFEAEKLKIKVGAGKVYANKVNALEGDFSVGAGELQVDQLTIVNESKYAIGTGEMKLKDLTAKDITVDSGFGDVKIEGTITGDNNIICNIGHIGLKLDGDKEDYSYNISTALSEVEIDGERYHHIDNKIINNNTDNKISLNNNIGNITVEFN